MTQNIDELDEVHLGLDTDNPEDVVSDQELPEYDPSEFDGGDKVDDEV